jgi:hypothetical protein
MDRLHEPALSAAEAKAYLSASIRPLQAMTLEASYHVQHMKQCTCPWRDGDRGGVATNRLL